ncbi:hypothetical protein NFI95_06145 [Acetobacteraceae bacterium KSS8]|uniref:Uncharacterized protein n=1 Tax=Endosaccharibacter trunci TaxID=2812733 RepID=A0ABT1W6I6_9PROT|nr:hypothetical protein [Acetobacteraceae bacterium KSS8]
MLHPGLAFHASSGGPDIAAGTHAMPLSPVGANGSIVQRAIRLGAALPMPDWLKRNLSRREAAFIAAAYAIPLPGTALIAALLVGGRRLFRRLRRRWVERSSMPALAETV